MAKLIPVPKIEVSRGVAESNLESDDTFETLNTAAVESVASFFLKIEIRFPEPEFHPAAKICHADNIELFVFSFAVGDFLHTAGIATPAEFMA